MISGSFGYLLYHFVYLTILYSALFDFICAWQCIKTWNFYYTVKVFCLILTRSSLIQVMNRRGKKPRGFFSQQLSPDSLTILVQVVSSTWRRAELFAHPQVSFPSCSPWVCAVVCCTGCRGCLNAAKEGLPEQRALLCWAGFGCESRPTLLVFL